MTDLQRRRYLSLAALALASAAGCTEDDEPSGNGNDESTPAAEETDPATAESTATQQGSRSRNVSVGEVAAGENLSMLVESVERTTAIDQFQEADDGNEFVVVKLAVKNTTESEYLNFSGFLQTSLTDDENYSYDQTFAVTDNAFDGGQLVPGEVTRGDVVYEVPQGAAGLALQFDFEAFGFTNLDRVTVDLTSDAGAGRRLEQDLRVDVYDVGETVSYEDVAVTVNDVSFTDSLGDFAQAGSGMEYAILDITTENGTDEEQNISTALQMVVKDGAGNAYDMDFGAQAELDRAYNEGQPLAAGETRRGQVAYEVPADSSPLYWIFEFTLWTEGDKTFWGLR